MKTIIRRSLVVAALAALSLSAFAAVSPEKRAWSEGPVRYLMTKQEVAAWYAIDNDAAADDFIALFWARRDPTPGTPRNEFREDFEAKVKFTDQQFTTGRTKGSLSDRGKVFIVFGQPLKAYSVQRDPMAKPLSDAAHNDEANVQRQVWVYESPDTHKYFNLPHAEVTFVDRARTGEYNIEMGHVDVNAAFQRAIQLAITQPDLKKAPVFEAPKPAVAAATPLTPAGIHTPALQKAIDDLKAKPASATAQLSYAEFVSSTGEDYVPVALMVPASANILLGAESPTIFGEVVDAEGKKVNSFEEAVRPVTAKNGWFVGRSLGLPAGKYTAYVGVARAGEPLLVSTSSLETAPAAKDAVGTSKLILWSDADILKEQMPDKSPYAFGNLQLVPNPSLSFTNQDEVGYFVEINNPGIDTATQKPKLQMSIELQSDGKPISRMPLAEAPVIPFGDTMVSHYVIVNSIPLPKLSKPLAPGNYTLKMKIVDTVTKQSYTVQENFKITG
jgi:GWxTD domain-containing protein